jgi:plasmid stability protein
MPTIQVRDLPEDVVAAYRARATSEGKSLQQYMRAFLTAAAPVGLNRDLFNEVERGLALSRNSVTLEDIVNDIREQRDAS